MLIADVIHVFLLFEHLPALVQREGAVILQLYHPRDVLDGLGYGGGGVVLELLERLVQEKYDGGQATIAEQAFNFFGAGKHSPRSGLGGPVLH